MTPTDVEWMQHAYQLAEKAQLEGEVPVGAIIVLNGECIGSGYNQPISQHDPTAHAEIVALRAAAKTVGNYRLLNTTLYVTLEPCCMCVGAMMHARIKRLVYAANDPKTGAVASAHCLLTSNIFNHSIAYDSGVMAETCTQLLRAFFKKKR